MKFIPLVLMIGCATNTVSLDAESDCKFPNGKYEVQHIQLAGECGPVAKTIVSSKEVWTTISNSFCAEGRIVGKEIANECNVDVDVVNCILKEEDGLETTFSKIGHVSWSSDYSIGKGKIKIEGDSRYGHCISFYEVKYIKIK